MCAKNHLVVFSSFLDIWENVEWPRFFLTTRYIRVIPASRVVKPSGQIFTFMAGLLEFTATFQLSRKILTDE